MDKLTFFERIAIQQVTTKYDKKVASFGETVSSKYDK